MRGLFCEKWKEGIEEYIENCLFQMRRAKWIGILGSQKKREWEIYKCWSLFGMEETGKDKLVVNTHAVREIGRLVDGCAFAFLINMAISFTALLVSNTRSLATAVVQSHIAYEIVLTVQVA